MTRLEAEREIRRLRYMAEATENCTKFHPEAADLRAIWLRHHGFPQQEPAQAQLSLLATQESDGR